MAVTRPFVFGTFNVFEGRSAYTLQSAQPVCYFDELSADMEGACYGAYFLEMASYLAQENMDGTELLTLVYQTLKALLNPSLPNRLIRRIFELKVMVINGEYTENPQGKVSESCTYTWQYVIYSPVGSLYTFVLKPEVQAEFEHQVENARTTFIRHNFRSLEILELTPTVSGEVAFVSDVVLVSRRAVTTEEGKSYVRVLEDGAIHKRYVVIGWDDLKSNIWIAKGVEPGQTLILG